jgi:UDP-N-acetyl-D-mannosaminuronic acid dehydrogenase
MTLHNIPHTNLDHSKRGVRTKSDRESLALTGAISCAGQSEFDVSVIGLGYIGLPTAAVIAGSGRSVLGIDINPKVVETVGSGGIHIQEVDLEGLVQSAVQRGLLRTSTSPLTADVFLIAVPTPFAANHIPDVSYVFAAAALIAPVIKPGDLIIIESTSPVGTTESVRDQLAVLRPDLVFPREGEENADIAMCYCPERVLPGRILVEIIANDRCIGGITPKCAKHAQRFYKSFVEGECVVTSARVAEMVKLVENSFRDVNIAFANELSMVCDTVQLEVWEVIRLANRHPRVNVLQPGPGVGGHCIAVDPWFIVSADPQHSRLIRMAREVNDSKVDYVLERAAAMIAERPLARIACLGLAFKANIDDLRESPAVKIAERLVAEHGSLVDLVEPHINVLPRSLNDGLAELVTLDTAFERCEIIIVLVDHEQFRAISLERLAGKSVYDTRGIWIT